MTRKLTPKQQREALAGAERLTGPDAARARGIEGLSARTIRRRLAELRAAGGGAPAKPQKGRQRGGEGDGLDLPALVAELASVAAAARAEGDLTTYSRVRRLELAARALEAKLAPPPPPPPRDEQFDYIAAAQRAKDKLHALVGRVLAERSGVACPTCGRVG